MAVLVSRFLLGVRKAANDASQPMDSTGVSRSTLNATDSTAFSFELQNTYGTSSDVCTIQTGCSGACYLSMREGSSTVVGFRVDPDIMEVPVQRTSLDSTLHP